MTAPLPMQVDADGPAAPPRRNGELVFEAPWEGRAFGLCVAVLSREELTWADFRPHLVGAIGPSRGAQRPVQRERMRRTALLAIGGHHGDVPHRGAHVGQQGQAARQDAVVVGQQDVHRAPNKMCRP